MKVIAILILLIFTSGAYAEIKIMPLGDSITLGADDENRGYRRPLYFLLSDYYTVDFVGSLKGGPGDFDRNHEGHGGWTAVQIRDNIYGSGQDWLTQNPADIILLHIGSNGLSNNLANEIGQILDKIDTFEIDTGRSVMVVLARIINNPNNEGELSQVITDQNILIQELAYSRVDDNIIVVDMESALNYPDDISTTPCTCHPTAIGYQKMANVWFAALVSFLSSDEACDSPIPAPACNCNGLDTITPIDPLCPPADKNCASIDPAPACNCDGSNSTMPVDPLCPNDISINGSSYVSIQAAYDAAVDGDTILVKDIMFIEDIFIDINKSVTLSGGYEESFITITGDTTINGDVTISRGVLIIENFLMQ